MIYISYLYAYIYKHVHIMCKFPLLYNLRLEDARTIYKSFPNPNQEQNLVLSSEANNNFSIYILLALSKISDLLHEFCCIL